MAADATSPRPVLNAQRTGTRSTICHAHNAAANIRIAVQSGVENVPAGSRSMAVRTTLGDSDVRAVVHQQHTAALSDWSASVRRIYSQARWKLARMRSSGNLSQNLDQRTPVAKKLQRTMFAVKSSASEGLKVRRAAAAFQDVLREKRERQAAQQAEEERQREHERKVAEWRVAAVSNVLTKLEFLRSEKRKSESAPDIKASDVLNGIDDMLGKLKTVQGEMAVLLKENIRVSLRYDANLQEINRLVSKIRGETVPKAPANVMRAASKLAKASSSAALALESPKVLTKPKPLALDDSIEEEDEQAALPFMIETLSNISGAASNSGAGSTRARLIQAVSKTVVRVQANSAGGRRESLSGYGPPSNLATQAARRRSRALGRSERMALESFDGGGSPRSSIFSDRSSISSTGSSWRDSMGSLPHMERSGDDGHKELDEMLVVSPQRSKKLWRKGRAAALLLQSPRNHTINEEGAEEVDRSESEDGLSGSDGATAAEAGGRSLRGRPAPPVLNFAELEMPEAVEETPRWALGKSRSQNQVLLTRQKSHRQKNSLEEDVEPVAEMLITSPRRARSLGEAQRLLASVQGEDLGQSAGCHATMDGEVLQYAAAAFQDALQERKERLAAEQVQPSARTCSAPSSSRRASSRVCSAPLSSRRTSAECPAHSQPADRALDESRTAQGSPRSRPCLADVSAAAGFWQGGDASLMKPSSALGSSRGKCGVQEQLPRLNGWGDRLPTACASSSSTDLSASTWAPGQERLPRLRLGSAKESSCDERPPHSAQSEPLPSCGRCPTAREQSPLATGRRLSPRPPGPVRPPSARAPATTIEGILLERKQRGVRRRCLAKNGDEGLWRRYAGCDV